MSTIAVTCFCVTGMVLSGRVFALDGAIGIQDPSTVDVCEGRYYVFGTGRGIPILTSSNGFDWQRGGRVFDRIPDSVKAYVPKNDGAGVWAPDIIKVDDQYFLYYSVSAWGQFVSAVGLMTSPTLNASDPKYRWTDRGIVVHSGMTNGLMVQTARYLIRAQQQWAVSPAGSGCYEIAAVGNGQAPGAISSDTGPARKSVSVELAAFTGADSQLWKLDQLSDGSYRIASKANKLALTATVNIGPGNGIALQPFTGDDAQHWVITAP